MWITGEEEFVAVIIISDWISADFSFEQFITVVESNLVDPDQLTTITESIDKKNVEQVKKILALASDYFPSLSYNVINDLTGRPRVIALKPNVPVVSNKDF